MLESIRKFFDRQQKPPYQAGTNLLLLLVLSVVIGAGVSYATLGFMKTFEHVVNWVYFDHGESPSGRYTHKFDARNNLQFDFRGNKIHGLEGLKQTQWPTNGSCTIVTTRDGIRLPAHHTHGFMPRAKFTSSLRHWPSPLSCNLRAKTLRPPKIPRPI